jgi:hypothetical protein
LEKKRSIRRNKAFHQSGNTKVETPKWKHQSGNTKVEEVERFGEQRWFTGFFSNCSNETVKEKAVTPFGLTPFWCKANSLERGETRWNRGDWPGSPFSLSCSFPSLFRTARKEQLKKLECEPRRKREKLKWPYTKKV